jgi:hypothetical protein
MDINALIESFYKENAEHNDVISEVLKLFLTDQKEPSLVVEMANSNPHQLEWSMIPDIPVSELGWSDVTTTATGETLLGPQRLLLQQYLDNIGTENSSFEEQIKSLQDFYTRGPSQIIAASKSNAEIIQKLISYLVFYKTLTKVVTNFNAASAGFNFESFLATLMHGQQIKANTGTIADFLTGENVPVSLKLYSEATLLVGGSFTDLVNDLVAPKFDHPLGNAMRYVICTKSLKGIGLQQKGSITFYQFDFTLDNIFDIIAFSKKESSASIRLPKMLIYAMEKGEPIDPSLKLPDNAEVSPPEELEKAFISNIKTILGSRAFLASKPKELDPKFPTAANIEDILQQINYPKSTQFFNKFQGLGYSQLNDAKLQQLIFAVYWKDREIPKGGRGKDLRKGVSQFRYLASVFVQANNKIVLGLSSTEQRKKRDAVLRTIEYESDLKTLTNFYKSLTPDLKKEVLKHTYGYTHTSQFELNRSQAITSGAPINTLKLGTITIGGAYIADMMKKVSESLNKEIFGIFNSLSALSDNLNSYFAGGLADDQKAQTAIEKAGDIQERTADLSAAE